MQNNFVNLTSVYKKDDDEKLIRLNLSPWNFEILQSKLDITIFYLDNSSQILFTALQQKRSEQVMTHREVVLEMLGQYLKGALYARL